MTPKTYRDKNGYYYPAVKHDSGRVQKLGGEPLIRRATALKYAQIHINEVNKK